MTQKKMSNNRGPIMRHDVIEPAYFEQPSQYVSLGNGSNTLQPSIATCMCPVSKVIGPILQRHQGASMAWGRCPSNMCDSSPDIKSALPRFGLTPSCSANAAKANSWF